MLYSLRSLVATLLSQLSSRFLLSLSLSTQAASSRAQSVSRASVNAASRLARDSPTLSEHCSAEDVARRPKITIVLQTP